MMSFRVPSDPRIIMDFDASPSNWPSDGSSAIRSPLVSTVMRMCLTRNVHLRSFHIFTNSSAITRCESPNGGTTGVRCRTNTLMAARRNVLTV